MCAAIRLCTRRQVLARVGDRGGKIEVRETGTRRGVVGHEDIRLLSVTKGLVAKHRNTDPFEVPMREIDTMQIHQTLGCAVQLLLDFSEGSGEESEVTHQIQSVGVILPNVFHDVPMAHPL